MACSIPAGTRPFILAVMLLPLLAGCGGGQGYPSLARRPAELAGPDGKLIAICTTGKCKGKLQAACAPADSALPVRVTGGAPVVSPAPAVVLPSVPRGGDLPTRLAGFLAEAQAAHARFTGKRRDAEARVRAGAGAAAGSDGWARATLALADLEVAHAATSAPLADLDRLAVDDRIDNADTDLAGGTERADTAAIRAATATVSAIADEEAATLATLGAALPR